MWKYKSVGKKFPSMINHWLKKDCLKLQKSNPKIFKRKLILLFAALPSGEAQERPKNLLKIH